MDSEIRHAQHYAEDAQLVNTGLDTINVQAAQTLDQLFRERVRRSPESIAYSQFNTEEKVWESLTWAEVASQVARWQVAFRDSGLKKGDRVAICYKNSIEWVLFDQAALRLGLVVVPLYTADRPDNIAYVIGHSGAKLVFFTNRATWLAVRDTDEDVSCVTHPVVMQIAPGKKKEAAAAEDVIVLEDWLPEVGEHLERGVTEEDDLASIVYTSGTTGRPKGVMLSHKNMLSNAYNGMRSVAVTPQDQMMSFLPLSHTLERTVGYYSPMMCGTPVAFNRSIAQLAQDLTIIKPTVMISVPRIFERIHNQIYGGLEQMSSLRRSLFKAAISIGWYKFQHQQGLVPWRPRLLIHSLLDRLVGKTVRDKLGGRMRFVVVGGAALSPDVSKTFIALGLPLLQGYGLTECSPVGSVNTLEHNRPDSIGLPLRGVELKLMENDELWIKGDNVMMGYWRNEKATNETIVIEEDGSRWLRSGDRASIDEDGFVRIIGRIKDILVLANGEKVPPPDIESAIARDPLFEQVMVVGEGRSYLAALVVLEPTMWEELRAKHGWSKEDLYTPDVVTALLARVKLQMGEFPGYARIRKLYATDEEWTVESGLMTPTLKVKRPKVMEYYAKEIDELYEGHGLHKSA
ncbi:MAG: long-chain fatty acid--CoA ligase [Pseudomonadota bacterium]